MRPTFSVEPHNGHRFVQQRIAAEAEEVWGLLEAGAKIYVCGRRSTDGPGVRDIYRWFIGDDGDSWLQGLMVEGRYVEDVYTAGSGDVEVEDVASQ